MGLILQNLDNDYLDVFAQFFQLSISTQNRRSGPWTSSTTLSISLLLLLLLIALSFTETVQPVYIEGNIRSFAIRGGSSKFCDRVESRRSRKINRGPSWTAQSPCTLNAN